MICFDLLLSLNWLCNIILVVKDRIIFYANNGALCMSDKRSKFAEVLGNIWTINGQIDKRLTGHTFNDIVEQEHI